MPRTIVFLNAQFIVSLLQGQQFFAFASILVLQITVVSQAPARTTFFFFPALTASPGTTVAEDVAISQRLALSIGCTTVDISAQT
jgi:hypothetical protein